MGITLAHPPIADAFDYDPMHVKRPLPLSCRVYSRPFHIATNRLRLYVEQLVHKGLVVRQLLARHKQAEVDFGVLFRRRPECPADPEIAEPPEQNIRSGRS